MLVLSRSRWKKIILCPSTIIEPVWIGNAAADIAIDSWPDTRVTRMRVPRDNGRLNFHSSLCEPTESALVSERPMWQVTMDDVLRIGDDVFVLIAEIRSGMKVRFAIHAPLEVPVHRWEVFLSILREQQRQLQAV